MPYITEKSGFISIAEPSWGTSDAFDEAFADSNRAITSPLRFSCLRTVPVPIISSGKYKQVLHDGRACRKSADQSQMVYLFKFTNPIPYISEPSCNTNPKTLDIKF